MTADRALLHDDTTARETALDVRRSFIVQAPAGSGKTELLIQRYLTLLATVDHPEEILAITFTRKAAAEMQIRVIEALHRAERGDVPGSAHERVTAASAERALAQDRRLHWDVVANPARLRIQTLDSLNASIARSQPLTTMGGAAGNSIIADAEMRALYRKAAALTLDQLGDDDGFQDATGEVLAHLDNNTDLYVGYLARMLATRDQWLPLVGSGELDTDDATRLRAQFEQTLASAVRDHLEAVRSALPRDLFDDLDRLCAYAASNLRDAGFPDHPVCAIPDSLRDCGTEADTLPAWSGVAEFLLTQQGEWRRAVNKTHGFPPGDGGQKERFRDLIDSLRQEDLLRLALHEIRGLPPVRYNEEQWRVLLSLFRLLPLTVIELQRLFAERSVSDHIEIALSAAAALGTAENPGDIALLLDYQIRHLLVDEMQDTSSAQYRMIEALTGGWSRGDGRTLFCVGDPMQSIYRFRNAEVGQFLLAQHNGIGDVELTALTLRRNFRSGEHLVHWFNHVFPKVLASADDATGGAVAYSSAVSVPALEGQGECVVHPLIGTDNYGEAEAGLQVIRELLAEHPADSVAVLVRSRTHLPALLSRLRKAEIAYRAIEIDRLTDLPEIIEVLALSRALAHRGDRIAWLALLRSPWAGLDWADLLALVVNDTESTVWELLNDNDRLAKLSPAGCRLLAAFRAALAPTVDARRDECFRDRVERTWLRLGGPGVLDDRQAVENVYRYLDVIEKIEASGSLADAADLEAALDMEHVSSDIEARLQVMTMHRAKGLQFDHVLLYSLGRIPRPRSPEVLSWVEVPDEHGISGHLVSPVGPRSELDRDPVHQYIGTIDSRKDRHELGRLLYVACTRARQSLHLMGHARELKSGLKPDGRSLLQLLWPAVAPTFEAARAVSDGGTVDEDATSRAQPVLRRFDRRWELPECANLPGPAVDVPEPATPTAVDYYWVGSRARFAGTVFHRWIHGVTEGRIDLDSFSPRQLQPAGERWLRELGVPADAIPAVLDRAATAIRGLANDARGRWLVTGPGHAEFALTGLVSGRIETAVIDRIRIDDDGTHWIVDYKTSSHEGGKLDAFLAAEVERYRPQLDRYAGLYGNLTQAPLRCALYFPVLQEFVEVPLERAFHA